MRTSFTSQDSPSFTSPKYQSTILPKSALDIEIVSVHQLNNGLQYNDQIFLINIHCDSLYYSIERSYIDYIEFYLKIKKKFPSCDLPVIPLDALPLIQKLIANKNSSDESSNNSNKKLDNRKSLSSINSFESPKKLLTSTSSLDNISPDGGGGGSRNERMLSRVGSYHIDIINSNENLQNKIPELQIYMRTLLTYHEIVVSSEFYAFFDEERPCNNVFNYIMLNVPTEIDLLMINTPAVTTTVRKAEEIILDVLPGQLVIWKFYLENYDIGFQVEVDGEIKVSYTRYSGDEDHPIIGSLEVGMRGKCFLKWDNSYAKLHNKVLTRQIRVVDPDQYNTAKNTCLEHQRERRKYESQRKSLRHATLRHAAAVSGVIHSSSVAHEIDEEDSLIIKEMREELELARKEKEDISILLQRTLVEVEELHEQNNELNTHIDNTAARLAELDEELAHSDHHIDNLEARINILEQEKADLQIQVNDLTDVVDAASLASQLATQQKQELINQYTQQIHELEIKLNQSQGDAESRYEDFNITNKSLTTENCRLTEELTNSLRITTLLENQNQQLQEENKNLNDSVQTHLLRSNEYELQLTTLNDKYILLKNTEVEVQQLLEIAKERVIQAEITTKNIQELYETSQHEIHELNEQMNRIKWRSKEEVDEWSEKINQFEIEIENLKLEKLNQEKNFHENQIEINLNLNKLTQERDHLNEVKERMLQQLEEKNKEILILQQTVTFKESSTEQMESLQNELKQFELKIETIERELNEKTNECHTATHTIQNLQSELIHEQSKVTILEEKKLTLEMEVKEMSEELKKLSERNDELQKSLELSSPSPSPPSSRINESYSQINLNLERALQDLREERDKYDNYRTKKDTEILELHRQLISSQEKLESIQKHNREMAETVEFERKNRTAMLNESKLELQETKKQLNELLKKTGAGSGDNGAAPVLSRRQSRTRSRNFDDDAFNTDESDGGDDDGLERAMIVKHHRDLAAARAEIADLAQQLVESAHREDEMQQCITDLQQEISIIMSHMTQLQQQYQLQGHATQLRLSTTNLLSERNNSSPSKMATDLLPNYELIEKYKQLYNETLERCQLLENEIIEEKEQMNQKIYSMTTSLHNEINKLQHENIELKKEIYDLKQLNKEIKSKRKSTELSNHSTNELIEKQKQMYAIALERCQYLENEILKEKEEGNQKLNQIITELNEELNQFKDENILLQEKNIQLENLLNDSSQQIEILKEREVLKNNELLESQQQLKFIRNTFQDIAKPLNRLLSQDDRSLNES